jgi:hypothetical protein
MADAAGLAELMVFYCEQAAGFSIDLGYQDESYFDALGANVQPSCCDCEPVAGRQSRRSDRQTGSGPYISHELGYGVGDDMDSILAKYTKRKV